MGDHQEGSHAASFCEVIRMARPKKDGTHVTLYLDTILFERLKQYAQEKGQTNTTAIERILKEYLDKNDGNNDSSE